MESFFRYIAYVDYYKKGEKIRNVGFLRWKLYNNEHIIEFQLKEVSCEQGSFDIKEQNTGKRIGEMIIDKGIGNFVQKFPVMTASDEMYIDTLDDRLYMEDVEGFIIWLNENDYLFTMIKFEKEKKRKELSEIIKEREVLTNIFEENSFKNQEKDSESKMQLDEIKNSKNELVFDTEQKVIKKQKLNRNKVEDTQDTKASENILIEGIEDKYSEFSNIQKKESKFEEKIIDNKELYINKKIKIIEPIHEDKWQQLCKEYPNIHPFSNNKIFLSIKPEDFIILQQNYQKLVHNSFLLHGFYNYGHMILGKISEEENAPVYIGVPGVYYEREKQAAQMFGFVGFESTEQPVQAGSYGYYMIEVEI